MEKYKYNWTRFYYPRSEQFKFDYNGYLEDPFDKYGKFFNSEAKTFEDISNIPCLILLGEPGIGKSYVIKKEYEAIKKNGTKLELIKLGAYSENRLERKLDEIKIKINIENFTDEVFRMVLLNKKSSC